MPIAAKMDNHPSASKKTGNFDSGATKISMGPITRRTITAKGNVDFFPQAHSGHLKTGQRWSPQERPTIGRGTVLSYPVRVGPLSCIRHMENGRG